MHQMNHIIILNSDDGWVGRGTQNQVFGYPTMYDFHNSTDIFGQILKCTYAPCFRCVLQLYGLSA